MWTDCFGFNYNHIQLYDFDRASTILAWIMVVAFKTISSFDCQGMKVSLLANWIPPLWDEQRITSAHIPSADECSRCKAGRRQWRAQRQQYSPNRRGLGRWVGRLCKDPCIDFYYFSFIIWCTCSHQWAIVGRVMAAKQCLGEAIQATPVLCYIQWDLSTNTHTHAHTNHVRRRQHWHQCYQWYNFRVGSQ